MKVALAYETAQGFSTVTVAEEERKRLETENFRKQSHSLGYSENPLAMVRSNEACTDFD